VKEREGIAAKVFAHAEPTIAGISAKLRMLAWHMNLEHAECANHVGVRTNELEPDEKIIASALADAGRIAGGAVNAEYGRTTVPFLLSFDHRYGSNGRGRLPN
jgi:hypothetical protein